MNVDVGSSMKADLVKFDGTASSLDCRSTLELLQKYFSDLKGHIAVVDSLLDRLQGTNTLVEESVPFKFSKLTRLALPNPSVS
jgi:hypothetical protein